ncbi:MinD/ParA family protein [Polaromonas sp.]|uniref:MinD/ParA family protein n=1 Tax=Polaromonas sp. TaxID=1869339 RepID=UPI003264D1AB
MRKAVTDQADGLRRLMAATPGRRVAVVGCEGPSVSSFTRNLAAALVQEGKDVLLIDERDAAQPASIQGDGRMLLLHAELDPHGALSPWAAQSDHILVVLQAHAASIKASYACIKGLHHAHALQRLRVLVDGAADAAEARRILANLAEAGWRYLSLALEPAGWVRADPHLARAQRLNATVVDAFGNSPAALDYRQVASSLLQWPQPRTHKRVPSPPPETTTGRQLAFVPCMPALH